MHELVANLHMHTPYSDGHGSHAEIAQAALKAGVDIVAVTDHNVLVQGLEGYYENDQGRVLMLVGEEIHDQGRQPQKSHLLVFGAGRELAPLASEPQRLVDAVHRSGGLAFIAHPVDPAAPAVGETDISWVDWDLKGIDGLEIWNMMSEFKSRLRSKLHAIYYAYNPLRVVGSPFPEVIQQWDRVLSQGRRFTAIGGSDAHALPARMGPLKQTLFPYEFHFRAINTHLLTPQPLSGNLEWDRQMVLEALGKGHSFIGYDLPASSRGFRFSANGIDGTVNMGDEVSAQSGVTLQVRFPQKCTGRLVHNGEEIKTWENREIFTHTTSKPGAYRVEAHLDFQGQRRGWIFSNPIYVKN
jgi:hypothetical protein